MTLKTLEQLKKDLNAAGYKLNKVTRRNWSTVLGVSNGYILSHSDRYNIIAIVKANKLSCEGTSLIGSGKSKKVSIFVSNAA